MKVWTIAEAAADLKVCKETLRRLIREGAPHRRIGRRILLTEADMAGLLEGRLVASINPFARKDKQKQWNTNATNTSHNNECPAATGSDSDSVSEDRGSNGSH